jgi:hypothetical protein
VAALVAGAELVVDRGDVAALRLGRREVVYVVGGYDLWVDGRLTSHTDLSAERAAALLRDEEGG